MRAGQGGHYGHLGLRASLQVGFTLGDSPRRSRYPTTTPKKNPQSIAPMREHSSKGVPLNVVSSTAHPKHRPPTAL